MRLDTRPGGCVLEVDPADVDASRFERALTASGTVTGDLLRHTWEDHDGVQVSARGDSCLAAFGDARSAVKACADAQRRSAAEPWPPGGRTGVRMGMHTGLATPRNGDYVGRAVHRTARVMSAAHGGQVLHRRPP